MKTKRRSGVFERITKFIEGTTRGWMVISKSPKGELSGEEIKEIMVILKKARLEGQLPPFIYQYREPSRWDLPFNRKEIILLKPENGELDEFTNKVNKVLGQRAGGRYKAEATTGSPEVKTKSAFARTARTKATLESPTPKRIARIHKTRYRRKQPPPPEELLYR